MKNIIISRGSRIENRIERIEDIFMIISGIAIGLSPLLAFV